MTDPEALEIDEPSRPSSDWLRRRRLGSRSVATCSGTLLGAGGAASVYMAAS